jgi:hypothetical protein
MRFAQVPLALRGWSQRSVWGWDEAESGWYADLFRDYESKPCKLIRPADGWYSPEPEVLARWISDVTRVGFMDVWAVMWPEIDKEVAAAGAAEKARLAAAS